MSTQISYFFSILSHLPSYETLPHTLFLTEAKAVRQALKTFQKLSPLIKILCSCYPTVILHTWITGQPTLLRLPKGHSKTKFLLKFTRSCSYVITSP